MTCNCYSYNWCIGEVQEVVLDVPKELISIIRREYVCVDACIVEDIKALWKVGIITHGACCGHNRIPTSVVLQDNATPDIISTCKKVLSRPFEFYSWMDSDKEKITKVG